MQISSETNVVTMIIESLQAAISGMRWSRKRLHMGMALVLNLSSKPNDSAEGILELFKLLKLSHPYLFLIIGKQ